MRNLQVSLYEFYDFKKSLFYTQNKNQSSKYFKWNHLVNMEMSWTREPLIAYKTFLAGPTHHPAIYSWPSLNQNYFFF